VNGQRFAPPGLVTKAEAARLSGYSYSTVQRLVARGILEQVVPAPGMKPRLRLADVRALERRDSS
jgi:hypothetical protein